ncbi:phage major capsid protein, HK97 family [Bryocella elongata]|uniref:Phage major capsid protein, HK97 family n=1 Tax=Bryocella elongata TaxID=863522 RepID=A0A1H6B623_9BACT|nr:phage major capsid protein [Bryocella elongata]SEG56301.1 phage major capsid protein, HK97 family [Bryocella elongata]
MNINALRQKIASERQKAQAIHDKAVAEGNRDLTAEERTAYTAHIASAMQANEDLTAALALMELDRNAAGVQVSGPGAVQVGHNNAEDKPWESLAEFMAAVRNEKVNAHTADVRIKAALGGNELVDAEGGILVPAEFAPDIIRRTFAADPVASRCRQQPMSSNRLVMNGATDASRADGQRNGGIASFWTREANLYTGSKPKFREMALQVDKLTVLTYATDEQLEDGPAWKAYVDAVVPDEFGFRVGDAIFNNPGNGSGPIGVAKSPAMLAIAKETGQTAATIVTKNVEKMYARMPSYLRAAAAFFINQDTEDQLWELTRGSGTAVELLYTPPGMRGNNNSYGVLLGLPVIPIEYAQTVGTQGDITLANFNEYMLGKRGGVKADTSIHVAFLTGEQAFRWQMRVAGQPLWDKPVTPKNGTNLQSPFIQLQTRS